MERRSRELFYTQMAFLGVRFGALPVRSGAPAARQPRRMHQCKQVWAGLVQHRLLGVRFARRWEGAPAGALAGEFGASHAAGFHLCVCALRYRPAYKHIPRSPTLPSACTGRAVGKAPATGAARTPFQGENCSFWGLWSLSGIRGKFFLVKDSPPLPCSGRCLYGAFQVPEELWEDFLFPFCYMAESQMSLGQIQRDLISHLKA